MAISFKTAETPKASEIKAHPLADLFPMMDENTFGELVQDIRKTGLREPIVLLDNKIIDGRNRYKACQEAGVKPKFEHYNGDNPASFVKSLNLMRRHMSASQRAMVAAELAKMPVGGTGENQHTKGRANLPAPTTNSEAAQLLNVSERSVKTAKKVRRQGTSALTNAVVTGDVSISAAAVIADQPEQIQKKVVSEKDPKKLNAAVKKLRKSSNTKEEKPAMPTPADTTVADQIYLQRQERIVTLIIEGLGEREPELLNMLSEVNRDQSTLFRYLLEKLKDRQPSTRKPSNERCSAPIHQTIRSLQ